MKKVLLVSLLLPTLMIPCNNGSKKKFVGWSLIGAGTIGTAASVANLIQAFHNTTDPNRMEKINGWAAGLGSSILAGLTGVTTLVWKQAPTIAPLDNVTISFANPNIHPTTPSLHDSAVNSSTDNSTDMYPGVYDLSELFQEPNYPETTIKETTIKETTIE